MVSHTRTMVFDGTFERSGATSWSRNLTAATKIHQTWANSSIVPFLTAWQEEAKERRSVEQHLAELLANCPGGGKHMFRVSRHVAHVQAREPVWFDTPIHSGSCTKLEIVSMCAKCGAQITYEGEVP